MLPDTVSLDIARAVTHARDFETLARPLLVALQTISGLESVYLSTIDVSEDAFAIRYSRNTQRPGLDVPEGVAFRWQDTVCCQAYTEGLRFVADADTRWPVHEVTQAMGLKTYLAEPVHALNGRLVGMLGGVSTRCVREAAALQPLFVLGARLLAHQWERERCAPPPAPAAPTGPVAPFAWVRDTADAATGLANRRAFDDALLAADLRALRQGGRVCVGLVELDNAPAVAATYGARAVEDLLRSTAARVQAAAPEAELVARFGRESFAVLARVPDRGAAAAEDLRQRLDAGVRGRFERDGVPLGAIEAGVAVAVARVGEPPEAVVARAEAGLAERRRASLAG